MLRGKSASAREAFSFEEGNMLGRDLEKGVIEVERVIGGISRTVFWVLFVGYTALLGVGGWFLYQRVLAPGGLNPHLIPDDAKNAIIVGLAVVVLGTLLAALTRDSIRNWIYRRELNKK
jgi:hypothetical protein